jgi:hypothetical protein
MAETALKVVKSLAVFYKLLISIEEFKERGHTPIMFYKKELLKVTVTLLKNIFFINLYKENFCQGLDKMQCNIPLLSVIRKVYIMLSKSVMHTGSRWTVFSKNFKSPKKWLSSRCNIFIFCDTGCKYA